jgi:hypothetical protein
MVVETNLREVTSAVDGMEKYQTATEALVLGQAQNKGTRKRP